MTFDGLIFPFVSVCACDFFLFFLLETVFKKSTPHPHPLRGSINLFGTMTDFTEDLINGSSFP